MRLTFVKIFTLAFLCCTSFLRDASAIGQVQFIETTSNPGSFPLAQNGKATALYVDAKDFVGVVRAANDLQADINRVTGVSPTVLHTTKLPKHVVIIGTIGKSAVIDRLISEHKIDVSPITGEWESFIIQVVANPLPGVDHALVIAGSDKRGAIYGIYDVSEQIGVSPWYFWADVPVAHKNALFVKAGRYVQNSPSVKYRGIFLNDEAPDLTNWIREKYGNSPVFPAAANYGRQFYTNLFEVILRMKGNYLWPAMWNNAFNEDDSEDARLADEYGVVMGTSHQEPMLRAQKEWDRGLGKKNGNWNYNNIPQQPVLQQFWRDGIRRNKNFESIITMGLRAENDSGAPIGADLTAQIVAAQRKILSEEMNPDLTKVPQLWCLYKEVQDFYYAGLRAPDDVTLLWAEDNWGDVRRLPTADERKRSGGAGIYYHFDYHGGPRSYQWVNTSPLPKIWDQLSLAKQYGADRIWIVNVGHFKGYELAIQYFLDLGWDTSRWTSENSDEYTRLWAEQEFGPTYAADIADILAKYTKYNGRRKPELVDANTYSVINYQEAERVAADYRAIATKAEEISAKLPPAMQDAFYQLVLFPTKAGANLNELYLAAARNALYAKQGRASANDQGNDTRSLFQNDTTLMDYYNHTFAHGKWDHFMDQSHIGYRNWQDPPRNSLRAVNLKELEVTNAAVMGVSVEGSDAAWPESSDEAMLPKFDAFNQQRHYLEVFNRGKTPFDFTAATSDPWITLTDTQGSIQNDKRIWVSVDWSKAPKGIASGTIQLTGSNTNVTVKVTAFNPDEVTRDSLHGFVEGEGVVSIEPEHFSKNIDADANRWIKIEDYGRTLSGMRASAPVDAASATPGKDSPCLQYDMYLFNTGTVEVHTITSPILNFVPGRGVRFAVSFDDDAPQIVELVPEKYTAQNGNTDWETSVKDNARHARTMLALTKPGYHTLKYWMIDPGVVLQKIVVNLGGEKPSYLGPPESYHHGDTTMAVK